MKLYTVNLFFSALYGKLLLPVRYPNASSILESSWKIFSWNFLQ